MPGPKSRLLAAASIIWFASTVGLAAQEQSNEIVVVGRGAEQTERFVEQISIAPTSTDQIARWDTSICASVAGLPQRQGQFLADQLARRANELGLSPGAPGCTPNVAIFVSNDANATARRMFEQDRSLFAYRSDSALASLGEAALMSFLDTPRAVRWWHVSETITADGFALRGDASTGGIENAAAVRSSGSRLRSDVRQDFARAIIIVDASRVGDVQLSALADYIAMVTLAQINPSADASGYPSILNLFAADPAGGGATELTAWDRAYLEGLYGATRSAVNSQQQMREIARAMQAPAS